MPCQERAMLQPNVTCISVNYKSWLIVTSAISPRLRLEDDPHAVHIRLIADVGDAIENLLIDEFGHPLDLGPIY